MTNNRKNNNLKIGLLRHVANGRGEERLIETARSRGHIIELINPFQVTLGINPHSDYNIIISRAEINSFTAEETDAYLRVLEYYQNQGIPIINSGVSIINAQDKFRTHVLVSQRNLRTPTTFLAYNLKDVQSLIIHNQITYPCVLKNPYGGRGEDIFLVKDDERLKQTIQQNFSNLKPILVQEFISSEANNEGGQRDMRIWVCRHPITNRAQFIGGIYRNARMGTFLTNISQQGYRTPIEQYSDDIKRISESALEAIGADVAGIDLMRDRQGNIYLLEINICFDVGDDSEKIIGENIWKYVIDLAESRAVKQIC
jgi:ribosomal protein S6--L-glutamate ligase